MNNEYKRIKLPLLFPQEKEHRSYYNDLTHVNFFHVGDKGKMVNHFMSVSDNRNNVSNTVCARYVIHSPILPRILAACLTIWLQGAGVADHPAAHPCSPEVVKIALVVAVVISRPAEPAVAAM